MPNTLTPNKLFYKGRGDWSRTATLRMATNVNCGNLEGPSGCCISNAPLRRYFGKEPLRAVSRFVEARNMSIFCWLLISWAPGSFDNIEIIEAAYMQEGVIPMTFF